MYLSVGLCETLEKDELSVVSGGGLISRSDWLAVKLVSSWVFAGRRTDSEAPQVQSNMIAD